MLPKVLIGLPLPDDLVALVAERGEPVRAASGPFPNASELAELLPRMSGIVCTAFARIEAALLARCPDLRVVSNCAVGLDNIDIDAATHHGIAVCNTPGEQDSAVAELAIALIMSLARNLVANDAYVRSGTWAHERKAPLGMDIAGKRLGLIGMGGIGHCVARAAGALGMDVVYFKRQRDAQAEAEGTARFLPRGEVFATADFVSLHLPLSAETRGTVGAAEFASMKQGAFLVNTARGAIIDEAALAAALLTGHLGGAGLDVFVDEPLLSESPLCALPNVILQPHAAGATRETRRRMEEAAVRNLLAVLNGERPLAIANPEVLG